MIMIKSKSAIYNSFVKFMTHDLSQFDSFHEDGGNKEINIVTL